MSASSPIRFLKSGKFQPLWKRYKKIKQATPELYGGSLLKNAWAEYPMILYFGSLLIPTWSWCIYRIYNEINYKTISSNPYRWEYCVIRPDDPRLKEVAWDKKDYYFDQKRVD